MMDERQKERLRNLPKVDELLLLLEKSEKMEGVGREILKAACRSVVEEIRSGILEQRQGQGQESPLPTAAQAADRVESLITGYGVPRLRRVINATGVILHTNLGRAPLCDEAIERIREVAQGYSNLEYDLEKGERGLRYDHIRVLLCTLTGAEDALVVNNNAAAVLLALNTLAEGKETIVSRGELIEIGGEFRIPEVMEKSGARLREVGTTNRTRIADYEGAIGPETGLILKVHTSNFKIQGFTESAGLASLATLGKRYNLPVCNDLGSGCFIDLGHFGLEREPTVRECVGMGADVITFSGDKLLGGPQAGIICGKRTYLERIRKNPLNRALRIDKLTLAALEATLIKYLKPGEALELRVLKALTEPTAAVRKRAGRLASLLRKALSAGGQVRLHEGASMAGGGSLPANEIPTVLVEVKIEGFSAATLETRLRRYDTPIVCRVADERILLDCRTLASEEFPVIRDALAAIAEKGGC